MRGDYTLDPLTYGTHHRGVQLIEIIEVPSDKYVEKYRSCGKFSINLYPVSRDQLMEPWI